MSSIILSAIDKNASTIQTQLTDPNIIMAILHSFNHCGFCNNCSYIGLVYNSNRCNSCTYKTKNAEFELNSNNELVIKNISKTKLEEILAEICSYIIEAWIADNCCFDYTDEDYLKLANKIVKENLFKISYEEFLTSSDFEKFNNLYKSKNIPTPTLKNTISLQDLKSHFIGLNY